eukprot:scaffold129774_cov13-Tisochrysis_lutea.AAC.1
MEETAPLFSQESLFEVRLPHVDCCQEVAKSVVKLMPPNRKVTGQYGEWKKVTLIRKCVPNPSFQP